MTRVMMRALCVVTVLLFVQFVSQPPLAKADPIPPLPVPGGSTPLSHQPLAEAENLTDLFPTTAVSVTVPTAQLNGLNAPTSLGDATYDVLISNASVPISAGQDTAVQVGNNLLVYSEANTFNESVDLALTQVEILNTSQLTMTRRDSDQRIIQFQVEALETTNQAIVDEFEKPVRIAVDVREFGIDLATDGGMFYLAYEVSEGSWETVPVSVSDSTGLFYAEVTHFSNWAAGWRPESWNLEWQPPSISEYTGSATYHYQFNVPPGRNGLQPDVSLSYSSKSLDGAMGTVSYGTVATGWSLSDITITRSKITPAVNGQHTPNYEDEYRINIGGVGTRLVTNDPAANPTIWYAEGHPDLQIKSYGDRFWQTGGVAQQAYWIINTADGLQYRLGYTGGDGSNPSITYQLAEYSDNTQSHSKFEPVGWHVDTVTDPFGNQIAYTYIRPARISNKYYHGCGSCILKTTTYTSQVANIYYNFPQVITDVTAPSGKSNTLPPAHNVVRILDLLDLSDVNNLDDNAPASRIEFLYWPHDPGDPQTNDNRLKEINVYHGHNAYFNSNAGINYPGFSHKYWLESTYSGIENANGCQHDNEQSRFSTTKTLDRIKESAWDNQAGVFRDLPATSFTYSPLTHYYHDESGTNNDGPCFIFQYLSTVENGYGATTQFIYNSIYNDNGDIFNQEGQYDHNTEQFPTRVRTYVAREVIQKDGFNDLGDGKGDLRLVYSYADPCYNRYHTTNQTTYYTCPQPETAGDRFDGAFAGFETVTVTRYDNADDGTILNRIITKYITPGNPGDTNDPMRHISAEHYQLYGKPYEQTVYAGEDVLVSEQETFYYGDGRTTASAMTFGSDANAKFMPVYELQTTEYDDAQSVSNKVRYEYNPVRQKANGVDTQLGQITNVRYYDDVNATDPYRMDVTWNIANLSGDYWLILPQQTATYAGEWGEPWSNASWYFYDQAWSDTMDQKQVPTKGELNRISRLNNFLCDDWPLPIQDCHVARQTSDTYMTYDGYGNILSTTTFAEHGYRAFDTNISLVSTILPSNDSSRTTTITYDSEFNLYPISVENPNEEVTTFGIYGFGGTSMPSSQAQAGLLARATDPNNHSVFYSYDPFGRLHETKEGQGTDPNSADPIHKFEYLDNAWEDNWSGQFERPLAIASIMLERTYQGGVPGFIEHKQVSYHDGYGRVIQTQELDVRTDESGARRRIVTTAYDALGRTVCTTAPYTIANGSNHHNLACNSASGKTIQTYDRLNPGYVKTTAPDGTFTIADSGIVDQLFDQGLGDTYKVSWNIDANRHVTAQMLNNEGQLFRSREYTGIYPTTYDEAHPEMTLYSFIEYSYDGAGNLTKTSHRNASGSEKSATTMGYDNVGHKISMGDADMGNWSYMYDAVGNLTSQVDANGNRLCFYYDKLDRLTLKTKTTATQTCANYDDAPTSGSNWLATYTYDSSVDYQNVTYGGEVGALTRVQWAPNGNENQEFFKYDDEGRVTHHTRVIGGEPFTMQTVTFDTLDRPTKIRYPDNEEVVIEYDREGENSLQAGSDELVSDIIYNAQGQLAKIDRSSVADTTYTYYAHDGSVGTRDQCGDADQTFANSNYRLTSIAHGNNLQDELPTYTYQYDAVGNITSISEVIQGTAVPQMYSYDHLNRLKEHCGDENRSYQYDLLGNLTSKDGVTLNYNSTQPHAVDSTSDGGNFVYDANGNMTSRTEDGVTYTQQFDAENRLTAVSTNGQTTQFFYDSSGQRTMSIEPNDSVTYYPFPQYEKEVGQLPTVTNLKANGQTTAYVLVNQPFDMAWNSNYAEGCTATGLDWNGPKDINGNEPITPTSTGTRAYTLTCHNEYGDSTTAQVTVHVGQLPTVSLTADGQGVLVVPVHQAFTLAWSSTSASSCTSNWTSSNATSGTQSLSLHSPQIVTYTRTCHNAYGSTTSAAVSVQTVYAPTVDMSVGPNPVSVGRPFTLEWDSQYTTGSCELSEPSGTLQVVNSSGTLSNLSQATPGTYTYTIQCSNAYGMMTSAEVAVMVVPWPTLNFTVNGQSNAIVAPFQSYTLAWNSANASGCTASGAWNGSKATSGSGSFIQKSYGLYSYTLTCVNAAGSPVFGTVTVTVEKIRCPGGCGGGSLDVFLPSWGVAVASQYERAEGVMAAMAQNVTEETRLIGPQPKEAVAMGKPAQQTSEVVIVRKTYSLAGQLIATRVSGSPHAAENGLFYHYSDHLGSASTIADASGNVVSNARYYPFGEYRTSPASNITELGYTGHHHNDYIKLVYMNSRWYDPTLGRFLSADTIVPDPTNPQAYNRYSYVYNNPLKYTDPTGHDPLGQQWVAQFTEAHGRSPAWFDELIRLFSIAYPDEWDWGSFYNPDGTFRGFGTTLITPPASRSWDTLPDALGRLEKAYSKDEKDFFVRDIAFLYAGMSGRSQNPGWKGMRPYWTLGTFPGNSFVYLQSGSLSQHFYVTPTGDHDADYNVHHWVWSFAMGYEAGFAETALVNMTREVGAAYNRGVPYDASDFYLGTAGALGGATYANSDESISTVLSSSLTVSPHALKTGVQLSPVILSFQYGLWP